MTLGRLRGLLTSYLQSGGPHQAFTSNLRDLLPRDTQHPTGPLVVERLTNQQSNSGTAERCDRVIRNPRHNKRGAQPETAVC